jgi:hypothetical protein
MRPPFRPPLEYPEGFVNPFARTPWPIGFRTPAERRARRMGFRRFFGRPNHGRPRLNRDIMERLWRGWLASRGCPYYPLYTRH